MPPNSPSPGPLSLVDRVTIARVASGTLGIAMVAIVIHAFLVEYATRGLFQPLGVDFLLYLTQATALQSVGPQALYDKHTLQATLAVLLQQANPQAAAGFHTVPYPPLFSWLLVPFSFLSPFAAFTLWTALNLVAASYLASRCAALLGSESRSSVLLVLVAYPIVLTVFLGQIQVLLACVVAEGYLAFRQSRNFRGGLWLGLLTIKPQYMVLLVIVLLWARRWDALRGLVVSAAVIWGGSAALVGIDSVVQYPQAFRPMLLFRDDWPEAMINWRSVILALRPGIGDPAGYTLTLVMAVVTIVPAVWVWHGRWEPDGSDFPAKLTLLLIAMILSAYHSHSYGAAILAAPLAATWSSPSGSRLARTLIAAGALVPTLILCADYPVPLAVHGVFARLQPAVLVTIATLIGIYAVVLWNLAGRTQRDHQPATPATSCSV